MDGLGQSLPNLRATSRKGRCLSVPTALVLEMADPHFPPSIPQPAGIHLEVDPDVSLAGPMPPTIALTLDSHFR